MHQCVNQQKRGYNPSPWQSSAPGSPHTFSQFHLFSAPSHNTLSFLNQHWRWVPTWDKRLDDLGVQHLFQVCLFFFFNECYASSVLWLLHHQYNSHETPKVKFISGKRRVLSLVVHLHLVANLHSEKFCYLVRNTWDWGRLSTCLFRHLFVNISVHPINLT